MIGDAVPHTHEATDEFPARRARGVALPGQRRPWKIWAIGFLGAALFLNALIGQNGYFETRRLEAQVAAEHDRLRAIRLENARLQAYAHAVKSDPAAIEDLARRNLGLIKPGEILFIITDQPNQGPAPAARQSAPTPARPAR